MVNEECRAKSLAEEVLLLEWTGVNLLEVFAAHNATRCTV